MSGQKEYSNGEVTIVWKADKCIHSANCVRGLPGVFNSKARPWINTQGADSESIRQQVAKCPSGALSIKEDTIVAENPTSNKLNAEIVVFKNGPLMVKGELTLKHKDGKEESHKEVYFCRCGQSSNKPFCDGTHKKCGFKDE